MSDALDSPAIASASSWLAGIGFRVVQPLPYIGKHGATADSTVLRAKAPAIVRVARPLIIRVRRAQLARLIPQGDIELLRIMAANCEHLEQGGRAIREYDSRGMQYEYDVIGRTQWVGKPEWADCGMSGSEIRATLEKAIAGGKLGKRQDRLMEAMRAELAETRANLGEVEAPQVCPF